MVDYQVYLAEVLLGYVDEKQDGFCFIPRIQGSNAIEIVSRNKYQSLPRCVLGICRLFGECNWPTVKVFKRIDGVVQNIVFLPKLEEISE